MHRVAVDLDRGEFAQEALAGQRLPAVVRDDCGSITLARRSHLAPQDGSQHFSALRFDGREDEFYELKAGDQLAILVSNDDVSKIREA